MKKVILMVLVVLTTLSVSAQRFGIKGGLNLAGYSGNDASALDTRVGFQLGGLCELPLSGGFYLQPEALLSLKGAQHTSNGVTASLNPYYLEIPVRGMYKLDAGTGKLTLAVGPYLAVGLFGKVTASQGSQSQSVDLFTDETGMKRLDLGVSSAIGYELPTGLFFNIESSLGLMNVADGGDLKNTTVALVAGFKF
jgi:hypothetical protein